MKRITPNAVYELLPCSVVAVGCALGITTADRLNGLISDDLHEDGYLSLDGMNRLVRGNLTVKKRLNYRRGERPALRDWAHEHLGDKAIVCVAGHFLYFDGRDYHSFFWNGGDPVISVWILDGGETND